MDRTTITQLWTTIQEAGLRLGRSISIAKDLIRRRRLPVILQLNAVECGAACLAMILSYYGRQTRVSECRQQCGVGRDGLTAQTIAEAARHYGLRVKAYSVGKLADFKHVSLPAIIHWKFNHFMVVERWSRQRIDVVDPAIGRRRLTMDEFDAGFTGVVLTLEPGIHFKRRRRTPKTSAWRNYLAYASRTPGLWRVLAQIIGASLLLQAFGLALPVFTKVLVDDILPLQITNVMSFIGIGLLILVLAQAVTSYLRAALVIYLQARLDSQLMLGFFEHVLTLPFAFFQQRSSGDLLMRLGSNATIRETLTSQTISAVLDGGLVLVYLIILLTQAPVFGLIALSIGAVQVALLIGTTRGMHRLMQQDLQTQAESQSYLVEALSGIATLKAAGAEDQAFDHWSNLFFKQLNTSLRRGHFRALLNTAMTTLRTLSPFLLLWVGALYVLNDQMSLGTMLALNTLATSFLTPLSSLVSTSQQLQLVGAHLDRITDVVEAAPEQNITVAEPVPALSGRIEVNGVNFGYNPNAPLALRDISLAIEPGQKVAVVGPTGSGKSTLAKLLLALYPPTAGEICYDGSPLSQLNYRSLRRQFGVVLQESFLFNGSIRQNLTLNNPNMPLEEIYQATRLAAVHQEILQMPMGYETVVAEGGSGLSGGQRQRLSLARALAHHPAVLLLDEATSHLDVVTESVINRNLNELACTRIVIAHRLSTIRDADVIVVLDKGRIVERGTHEALMAQNGRYASLIQDQLETRSAAKVSSGAVNGSHGRKQARARLRGRDG